MAFESKILSIEENLENLIRGIRGVRHIRGCSAPDLECYRISFDYQRRDPLKKYLLIYHPNEQILRVCAEGGIGNPPENVRQRLLNKLGSDRYRGELWAYSWSNIDFNELLED